MSPELKKANFGVHEKAVIDILERLLPPDTGFFRGKHEFGRKQVGEIVRRVHGVAARGRESRSVMEASAVNVECCH